MTTDPTHYPGGELELFAGAVNWKSYVGSTLRPFIRGRVLEVGAGIGANIPYLYNDRVERWTSVEPDPKLAGRIAEAIGDCRVVTGTIADIDPVARYDSVLYIDVLEHIADDAGELAAAARHLAEGGKLVVLSPAHPFLFSPFDAAIGHYRRYRAHDLAALTPAGCRLTHCFMLDAAGFFASAANAMVMKSSMPSAAQIRVWDRLLVPVSRVLDRGTGHRFGKTLVAVWSRDQARA